MSEPKYIPISQLPAEALIPLMQEEEQAWMSDLCWDYSPIRQILDSFIRQKLLPGYVAVINKEEALAYTYFLVNRSKGTIGALYASNSPHAPKAVEQLLSLTIASLKDSPKINRIEAQLMPFNGQELTSSFLHQGFHFLPRYYLSLDLALFSATQSKASRQRILSWDSAYIELAAKMTLLSYKNQADAEICEDYRTQSGCEGYLRSLIQNPGCGVFMPDTSFIALDDLGALCGYIICCCISNRVGMIPQIAIHPSHQGKGVGSALMFTCLEQLKAMGFLSASLTVTLKNQRAHDWYRRLGFEIRKEFGAFVWERNQE
jgi:ribosomal protein S18 acetylase RimI-like enzyme